MNVETLSIASRFHGPPRSGNGGYVCGRIARHVAGPAVVRLKAPAPLETPLQIAASADVVQLLSDARILGEGRSASLDLTPPPPPSFEAAEAASKSYLGFTHHPFPTCFVCGPRRAAGDGLRIFPGWIGDRSLVAAPWCPHASLANGANDVRPEFLWSALDCTSGFAVLPVPEGRAVVLGELSARIEGTVMTGEKCVAAGWPIGIEGRKRIAGSAIFSGSGEAVAVARATWIEVDASAFVN